MYLFARSSIMRLKMTCFYVVCNYVISIARSFIHFIFYFFVGV